MKEKLKLYSYLTLSSVLIINFDFNQELKKNIIIYVYIFFIVTKIYKKCINYIHQMKFDYDF